MHYWYSSITNIGSKRLIALPAISLQRNVFHLVVCSLTTSSTCHKHIKKKNSFYPKWQLDKSFCCASFVAGSSHFYILKRNVFTAPVLLDKSKLEDSLIEKQKQKKASSATQEIVDSPVFPQVKDADVSAVPSPEVSKPPLWRRIVAEVKHYYHGFRLLFLDIRIASRTLWKILRGRTMTRREHTHFRKAVADIFRLLPFSVFIIIPFAELALPFALKFFPGMLPSTFETLSKKETRLKRELKVKLEMAKFLQDTVEDIAVHANKKSNVSQNFIEFFKKTRVTNQQPTNEEILLYAKLFKDELTLSSINRPQLIALCRLLQVPTVGTNEFLRLLLEMKLGRLHRDDELIMKEGVDSLTTAELMQACQSRGMRALGVPRKRLKQQLTEWIDLHLNYDVPSSLLLLSRVLYLPESVSTEEKVKAVISALPEKAAGEAEVRAAELNLERVDNTARYKAAKLEHSEIISEEAEKVKQEKIAKEQADVEDTEKTASDVEGKPKPLKEEMAEGPVLVDTARVIHDDNKITQEEIDIIDDAISKIQPGVSEDTTAAAKTELNELREDVEEYQTDIKTLSDEIKDEEHANELQDTKAGQLLQRRISKMIDKMDLIINDLEKSAKEEEDGLERQVAIHELVNTMHSLTKVPADKLRSIFGTLDINKDGHIDVNEARNIIKLLNQEDVEVTAQQLEQIAKLLLENINSSKENTADIKNDKIGEIETDSKVKNVKVAGNEKNHT